MRALYDLSKIFTLVFIASLIYIKEVFTLSAWLYLGFYTSYFLASVIKRVVYPDKSFDDTLEMGDYITAIPLFFGIYWILPFVAIVVNGESPLSHVQVFASSVLFVVGLVTLTISEMELYHTLLNKPNMLVTEGMRRFIRRPNLIGEALVYGSFAILSRSVYSWVILAIAWVAVFIPYNYAVEKRLERYGDEWIAYKDRTNPFSQLSFLLHQTPGDTSDFGFDVTGPGFTSANNFVVDNEDEGKSDSGEDMDDDAAANKDFDKMFDEINAQDPLSIRRRSSRLNQ